MGTCPCFQSNPKSAIYNENDTGQNKNISSGLKSAAKADKQIKKLLFLGSGGSGKSTLFKQLRTIHGHGYNKQDCLAFIPHIHSQIVEQMQLAIECLLGEADYDSDSQDTNDQKSMENIMEQLSESVQSAINKVQLDRDHRLTIDTAEACKTLWREPLIQSIYEQRAVMGIEDSSAYFWDKIDEVMAKDYVPNKTDLLMVRYRTTGVIEQKFTIQKNTFHIFDVGGQKSERKKWIHCFEGVTAVIFVASLSCYDEVMFEDESTNSMTDTLQLFEQICNETYFAKTSMILFLNKKDLFAEKLNQNKPITFCPKFGGYSGDPLSFEDTTEYIKAKFEKKNRSNKKTVYTHLTCATDQNNVNKVFNDVQHIIIEASLTSAGLMGDMDDDMMGFANKSVIETDDEETNLLERAGEGNVVVAVNDTNENGNNGGRVTHENSLDSH